MTRVLAALCSGAVSGCVTYGVLRLGRALAARRRRARLLAYTVRRWAEIRALRAGTWQDPHTTILRVEGPDVRDVHDAVEVLILISREL